MSLCDSCYRPGHCCMEFGLGDMDYGQTAEGALIILRKGDANPESQKMPFLPKYLKDPETGYWRWRCPKLGDDGRCTDYENRPDICRIFEPALDVLCVHFKGAEGGTNG